MAGSWPSHHAIGTVEKRPKLGQKKPQANKLLNELDVSMARVLRFDMVSASEAVPETFFKSKNSAHRQTGCGSRQSDSQTGVVGLKRAPSESIAFRTRFRRRAEPPQPCLPSKVADTAVAFFRWSPLSFWYGFVCSAIMFVFQVFSLESARVCFTRSGL